jgi:hypothetical protein
LFFDKFHKIDIAPAHSAFYRKANGRGLTRAHLAEAAPDLMRFIATSIVHLDTGSQRIITYAPHDFFGLDSRQL